MKVVIPGKFPSLNDYIAKNRQSAVIGNRMKQSDQLVICSYLPKGERFEYINIVFDYYEPSTKRDKDNISSYFKKIFLDALVATGIIADDGWKHIADFTERFHVDKNNPRIEVEIYETGTENL